MLIVGAGYVLVPSGIFAEQDLKYVLEFLRLGTGKSESDVREAPPPKRVIDKHINHPARTSQVQSIRGTHAASSGPKSIAAPTTAIC